MALFGRKKESPSAKATAGQGKKKEVQPIKEKEAVKKAASKSVGKSSVGTSTVAARDLSWVLHSPRLSEKAMYASDRNVYVFNIHPRANKAQVALAVKDAYKVEPKKVRVSKIAKKNTRNQRTGIKGVKGGGKKAYVYLKEGDKINIV